MAMLRARIRALGVSRDEERSILEGAGQLMEAAEYAPDAQVSLRRLAALAGTSAAALTRVMETSRSEERPPSIVIELREYFHMYAQDFREWAEKITDGERVPIAFVRHRINGLGNTIERLLGQRYYDEGAAWLAQHREARRTVWELQWALMDEQQKLASLAWKESGPVVEEIDRFLAIFYGAAASEASPPWELPELGHAR